MQTQQSVISEQEIAQRAYEIWQSRGCPPGDGADDWRAAQTELLARRVHRNGSTQMRMQSWWQRMRVKIAGHE
jgi:Protein of unknown function (DUF2934)